MLNDVAAAKKSRPITHEAFYRLFDAMPRVVRVALWEAVVDWDVRQTAFHLKRGASPVEVVKLIRCEDSHEINAFSGKHYKKHKQGTPHQRARATIQRYAGK
jgi:hypothetical protein